VAHRTDEHKKVHDELLASNDKLKINFLTSIKVFSSIVEMRGSTLAGHSRRVADLARRIALRMGLDARDAQEIFIAGLLHNIGKIGFSDALLAMPVSLMNGENLGLYRKYPIRGEQLLMPLEDLRGAAGIVRSHQERFDGEGFPDRLSGFDIPIGARMLAVASDYDNLQIGTLAQRQLRPDQAAAIIIESRGKRYDPAVVAAFQDIISGKVAVETVQDEPVAVADLRPGMVTTRDLVTRDGSLLLSADHVLNERLIRQIADFEKTSNISFTVYVRVGKDKS
jgi:response regulator RpfG family c-di-GMP phosphodiesterase